jgi:SNF2 family DNA or RNA helicase
LSRINWSIAAFDEAQNIKNPNALSTIAAKALNADFKLLATGTPVENTLKDFWCLMDTAVPGLLGAWQSFRKTYIVPITAVDGEQARQRKQEVGSQLRQVVGDYMLRRTKEDNLKGLPQKKIYAGVNGASNFLPVLAAYMNDQQLKAYNSIIAEVHQASAEDKRKVVLPSLHKLKLTSIHHDLLSDISFRDLTQQISQRASGSSKITALLQLLHDIKKRNEKVLIFTTSKRVQAYVSALVSHEFRVIVETINGETKAVANKKDDATRKGIIDKFQSAPGFGVLIMSPVAAGVGLTVTGANNVIHLERHWNPAKEAQATDRVYRIGQKREVNVYIPIALHPNQKSFDEHLNSLLGNKVDLSNAVVAPYIVEAEDLSGIF